MKRLLATLAALLMAGPASAALTYDGDQEGAGLSTATALSSKPFSEGLVVFCVAAGTGDFFTGATADGTALTYVDRVEISGGSVTEPGSVEVYFGSYSLLFTGGFTGSDGVDVSCTQTGSPSGVYTMTASLNSSSNFGIQVLGTATSTATNGTNPQVDLSSYGSGFAVVMLYGGFNAITDPNPIAANSYAETHDWGLYTAVGAKDTGEGTLGTFGFTTSASADYAIIGVAFREITPPTTTWSIDNAGPLATNTACTTTTSCAVTLGTAAEAGKTVICAIAKDETTADTANGAANEVTAMTDSTGANTWTEIRDHCNYDTSATSDGSCQSVWYSNITSEIAAAGTITATFASSTGRAVMECDEFTNSAGRPARLVGVASSASDGGAAQAGVGSDMSFGNALWYSCYQAETNNSTYYADVGWYPIGTGYTNNSGVSDTSQTLFCQYSTWVGPNVGWGYNSFTSRATQPNTGGTYGTSNTSNAHFVDRPPRRPGGSN